MIQERQERIVDIVNRQGLVHFSELVQAFPHVSEMTLRKDLRSLDAQQRLVRVHGGARSLSTIQAGDLPLSERLAQNMDKKCQIAEKARKLLRKDAVIFMDSGSTMTQLARVFTDQSCHVLTGGLSVAAELSKLLHPDIYLLGGRLNKDSLSVRDSLLVQEISHLCFDVAFIAVNGYTDEYGFSCRSAERFAMERTVLQRAKQTVVLMDSTKVGKTYGYCIAQADEIDVLVSDDALDEKTCRFLKAQGVSII